MIEIVIVIAGSVLLLAAAAAAAAGRLLSRRDRGGDTIAVEDAVADGIDHRDEVAARAEQILAGCPGGRGHGRRCVLDAADRAAYEVVIAELYRDARAAENLAGRLRRDHARLLGILVDRGDVTIDDGGRRP